MRLLQPKTPFVVVLVVVLLQEHAASIPCLPIAAALPGLVVPQARIYARGLIDLPRIEQDRPWSEKTHAGYIFVNKAVVLVLAGLTAGIVHLFL